MESKYKVSRNILYNFLGQGILLLVGILTLPYIINKLGKESFGIIVLLTSFVGYFSILDFGLGSAIIKNISDSYAKGDKDSLKKIISTSFTTFSLLGLIGAVLIILSTKFIVQDLLHISPALSSSAELAFYISAVTFFISMISIFFVSIPSAFQRMDIVNSRNIFLGLLNALGTVLLLALGYGLIAVVIWTAFISALATLGFFLVIVKILPISIRPGFDKKTFLQLFRFGGYKFISNISGQIIFQLDRFLIGIFQPIVMLAFYNPPLTLVQKSFTSLLNVTSATFPAISESNALGDIERVKQLYLRMSKLIALIMFPVLAVFLVGADQLMYLWLGEEFAREGAPILKIFAIAYIFITISAAPVVISEGMNKPKIPAIFGLVGALINLIAALILIPSLGIIGAALALLINCVLQVPIFVWFVHRRIIKIPLLKLFLTAYMKPAAAAIIASLLSAHFLQSSFSIINITFGLLIFSSGYILLNILFKTFNDQDKLALKYFFAKITK